LQVKFADNLFRQNSDGHTIIQEQETNFYHSINTCSELYGPNGTKKQGLLATVKI